jgi:hypothetical protein
MKRIAAGEVWRQIQSELAANARLRVGVLAIAAIVLLYGWLLLLDWRDAAASEYAAQRQRLEKIQALAGQDYWLARATEAAELRAALEAQLPEADTLGLAQASVQSWARDLAAVHGDQVRIRGETPVKVPGQALWRIPVTISGSLPAGSVLQLIQRIEQHSQLITIEQSSILNRANRTFSLTVVAFYRVRQEGADDAA